MVADSGGASQPFRGGQTRTRIAADSFGQYDGSMNFSFGEMVFIFAIALIIFGPKKLPEIGRQIGKALNEFKRASNEFKAQIEAEISQIEAKSEPQILPPVAPPVGAIAAYSEPERTVPALSEGLPEIPPVDHGAIVVEAPLAKAPDA